MGLRTLTPATSVLAYKSTPKPPRKLHEACGALRNLHANCMTSAEHSEAYLQTAQSLRSTPKPSCTLRGAFGALRNLPASCTTLSEHSESKKTTN